MDVSRLTDIELQEEINRLRAEREKLADSIQELTIELLNRHPPSQVGSVPKSIYDGW